jgi:hypothetical protein
MGEVVLGRLKEIKAMIRGGRERTRATAPLREEIEISEGTQVSDGGSLSRAKVHGGGKFGGGAGI